MTVHRLQPHPAAPPQAVTGVGCVVSREKEGRWLLEFHVAEPSGALAVPPPRTPGRADGLWKTTCFEMFLRRPGEAAYVEFNLSPSGEWAAYAFDGYRQGMADLDAVAPKIEVHLGDGVYRLRASLDLPEGSGIWLASLSAVIEEAGGAKSYWALAHASDKPDFHHPDSFVLELP